MSNARRHPNVVNLSEVEPTTNQHGARFASSTRWLGPQTQASGLGCSWFEVPPGKTAFPHHYHCANEEAAFILEGEGTLRIGAEKVPVKAGDFVSFPPGPDHAHQLLNTGSGPLRYLAISTQQRVEVVGYPDSKKLGAAAVTTDNGQRKLWVREMFRPTGLSYYDGED